MRYFCVLVLILIACAPRKHKSNPEPTVIVETDAKKANQQPKGPESSDQNPTPTPAPGSVAVEPKIDANPTSPQTSADSQNNANIARPSADASVMQTPAVMVPGPVGPAPVSVVNGFALPAGSRSCLIDGPSSAVFSGKDFLIRKKLFGRVQQISEQIDSIYNASSQLILIYQSQQLPVPGMQAASVQGGSIQMRQLLPRLNVILGQMHVTDKELSDAYILMCGGTFGLSQGALLRPGAPEIGLIIQMRNAIVTLETIMFSGR